jgi:tRNA(Glu) U13 pseudouridine synthase TruD
MPGPKMLAAEGEVAEHERSVMAAMGLSGDEFSRFAKLCSGTRRAMLEFPFDVEATQSDILTLSFSLRSGAYATVMLREICENIRDAAGVADAADGLDDSDPQTEEG